MNLVMEPLEREDPVAVGGYRLRGRLGSGGMGVVFLAGDPDQPVAIKTMRAADLSDSAARVRFRAEAECARRLNTSATPKVLSDGSDEPVPYLVTEYISGPNLAQVVIRDGPLPVDALYAVAIGVADALTEIHRAGIVHRDVKPSNVLLAKDGPKIIDFGIARQMDSTGGVTQTGMVMGSPGWVSPERLTGGPATTAADVFCWGILVAYAATGRHPFGSDDASHVSERILTLSPDLTMLTEPLRGLVKAALAKDPAARPKAVELREALMAPRSEHTASQAVQRLWTPPRRKSRRHRLVPAGLVPACAGATAAVLLLLLLHSLASTRSDAAPTVTAMATVPRQAVPGQAVPRQAVPNPAGPSKAVAPRPTTTVPSPTSKPSGTTTPTPTPSVPISSPTPSVPGSSPTPSASTSAPEPAASTSAPEPSATSTKKPKKPKKKDEEIEEERTADRIATDFG